MAGRVRDAEGHGGGGNYGLRRDAASPKHRKLIRVDIDRIAVVRPREVGNADLFRQADVYRRTMHRGETPRDQCCPDRLRRAQRAHGYDHRAMKRPGGLGWNVGAIHRHVAPLFDMTQPNAVSDEGFLERERAAEQESHQISAPMAKNIGRFGDEFSIPPYAITGKVGADIEILPQARNVRLTRFGNGKQRAGLRVLLAKAQKIESP